ncbi:MAG: hypothetical protein AAFO91_14565, partial [Bacteroidota bacterium]
MKTLLLFVFSIAFLFPAQAALVHPGGDANTTEIEEFSKPILTLDDLRTMRNRDIRDHLGRRVSLGESLAFSLIRGKLKRQDRRQARRERRNARRVERGLLPMDEEVGLSDFWLALGSVGAFALGVWLAVSTPVLGWIIAGISFIGMLIFGSRGRRKYMRVKPWAFWGSSIIYYAAI